MEIPYREKLIHEWGKSLVGNFHIDEDDNQTEDYCSDEPDGALMAINVDRVVLKTVEYEIHYK